MIATQETHTFRHKTYRAHTKYNYRLPYITSISYSRRRYHMCYYTPLKVGKYYIIYYILLCALKIQKKLSQSFFKNVYFAPQIYNEISYCFTGDSCGIIASLSESEPSVTFSSPNFPDNYNENEMCSYLINVSYM